MEKKSAATASFTVDMTSFRHCK